MISSGTAGTFRQPNPNRHGGNGFASPRKSPEPRGPRRPGRLQRLRGRRPVVGAKIAFAGELNPSKRWRGRLQSNRKAAAAAGELGAACWCRVLCEKPPKKINFPRFFPDSNIQHSHFFVDSSLLHRHNGFQDLRAHVADCFQAENQHPIRSETLLCFCSCDQTGCSSNPARGVCGSFSAADKGCQDH